MFHAAQGQDDRARELQDMFAGTSSLRRVVAVGQTRTVGDVAVDLLSLELREASGGGVMVMRRPRVEQPRERLAQVGPFMRRPDHDVPSLLMPELDVTDNVGTRYHAYPAGGGGDDAGYRWEFRFFPAPPTPAAELALTVRRFAPMPFPDLRRPGEEVVGPWSFRVALS
jgi:hypothetical protein